MTVQKLLDRLAHVADKTKTVVVVDEGLHRQIMTVQDAKGKTLFIRLEEKGHEEGKDCD